MTSPVSRVCRSGVLRPGSPGINSWDHDTLNAGYWLLPCHHLHTAVTHITMPWDYSLWRNNSAPPGLCHCKLCYSSYAMYSLSLRWWSRNAWRWIRIRWIEPSRLHWYLQGCVNHRLVSRPYSLNGWFIQKAQSGHQIQAEVARNRAGIVYRVNRFFQESGNISSGMRMSWRNMLCWR